MISRNSPLQGSTLRPQTVLGCCFLCVMDCFAFLVVLFSCFLVELVFMCFLALRGV